MYRGSPCFRNPDTVANNFKRVRRESHGREVDSRSRLWNVLIAINDVMSGWPLPSPMTSLFPPIPKKDKMMNKTHPYCVAVTAFFLISTPLSAATYHVDFAGGSNTADGLTPQTAWKHSPGDPNATDNPKSAVLAPGDTLLFKGGVAYLGSIKLTTSGSPDKPITLDGNSAGTYGEGRAVIDGGSVIEGWKRLESAEQAKGNPRWKDIFVADINLDIAANFNHGEVVLHRQVPQDKQAPWQRVILYDGDQRLLPIAQHPKPSDPFYPDIPGDFLQSPNPIEKSGEDGMSYLTEEKYLSGKPAHYFDDMFVGLHGGNNHVYFAAVKKFDPDKRAIYFAPFKSSTYPTTKFAFYNSVKLIEQPGEWAITPVESGKSRVFLLADRLENGQPANIGFPILETGVSVDSGASHIRIQGFLIQRFAGAAGGVSVSRNEPRARDIAISNCEIRFISGHAGIGLNYCDNLVMEKNYIHHCPGWTTAIFFNRVNDYTVRNCRLDKNSGSGIRHYEAKRGKIQDNAILNHYGMHSSTINVYEGCEDVLIERNYLHNTVAINRKAENITFRHNIIDSQGKSPVNVAMWTSGRTGGNTIKNIVFENNTFVNLSDSANYFTSVFCQTGKGAALPEGIIARNNIFDRLRPPFPATVEKNIFLRETEDKVAGTDGKVVGNIDSLFLDPEKGDYRRKPGGPMMEAGADLPPPAESWNAK
jgi:hypothetical protein